MITWVIIIVLIVLVLIFLRLRHFKHKIFAVTIILLIFFFYLTLVNVISNTGLEIKDFNSVVKVTKIYFAWLGNVFSNFKEIAGNIIKMEWKFENSSVK